MESYMIYVVVFGISILISYLYQNKLKRLEFYKDKVKTFNKSIFNSSRIRKNNCNNITKFIWFIFIIFFPVLISSIRYGIGRDYYAYLSIFEMYGHRNFIFPKQLSVEYGYYLLNYISGLIFKDFSGVLFLSSLIIAVFVLISVDRFKTKISIPFALFIYYIVLYPSTYNIIRQMIGVAIIMYAYRYAVERNIIKYVIWVLIASVFHKTAIICLPWYVFGIKMEGQFSHIKKLMIVAGMIFISLALPFILELSSTISIFEKYFLAYDFGSNAKIIKQLLLRMPVLIPLIVMEKRLVNADKEYQFYIFIFYLELVCIFVGVYYDWGFRLAYYAMSTEIILIPAIIRTIKNAKLKMVIGIYFVCWYISYFVYSYGILGNDGILPYKTILGF